MAIKGKDWHKRPGWALVPKMPGKPYRSALEPFYAEISAWRAARKTWQEIAALLAEQRGLSIHYSAVQKYFARRKRRPERPLGFETAASEAPAPRPRAAVTAEASLADPFTPSAPPPVDPFTVNLKAHGQKT